MKLSTFQKKTIAITPFICLFAYLLIGFVWNIWHPTWLIFFLVPIMPYLVGRRTIRITVPLVIVIIYLVLGFTINWWHPGWLLFLLIPVFEILFSGKSLVIFNPNKKKEKKTDDVEFIDIEEDNPSKNE